MEIKKQREQEMKAQIKAVSFVTWIGLWLNVFLCLIKFIAGALGNSRAVVADAVHSLSDLLTDIIVLVGVHFWVAPADDCHPYGHQRLESLISLVIGVCLACAGIGIAYDAMLRMSVVETKPVGSIFALGAVLLSCISKEILYRWTLKKGHELKSEAVAANAWDHRSDAISSIPTLIGVALAMWLPAFAFADRIAAIVVALFILHAAWSICRPAIDTLLDKGASKDVQKKIMTFARTVEGIKSIHNLRTRYLGSALGIDMHAAVDGTLTVAEGNALAHQLEEAFYTIEAESAIGIKIADALVHIDPVVALGVDPD